MEHRRRWTPKNKTPHPRHCPPKTKALPKTKDPFLHAPNSKIPSPAKSTRRRSLMGCRERLGGWTEAGRVGGGQSTRFCHRAFVTPRHDRNITPPPRHHPLPTPPTRPTLPKPTSHHRSLNTLHYRTALLSLVALTGLQSPFPTTFQETGEVL